MPDAGPDHLAREERFFRHFAEQFMLSRDVLYFMNGQKGSMPAPILAGLGADIEARARDPFPVYLEDPRCTREELAASFGAETDEIAISHNTTDALAQIFMGLEWREGDEIVASALEHPAGIAPILRLARRFGVRVRQFGVPVHPAACAEDIVEAAAWQMRRGRTRVLFFSSPLWPNGMRMPERLLARLAQDHGAVTIVDGAHFAGMLVPELSASGVDFWALSGHKWQCGPGGTGILYVRNHRSEANPAELPRFHLMRSATPYDVPLDGSRPSDFDIGAALTYAGSPEGALWRALAAACRLWDETGRARIEAWILGLADYMRTRIVERFGDGALLQPWRDARLRTGIVAFNPFGRPALRQDVRLNAMFRDRLLREFGIRISGGAVGPHGFTRAPDPEAAAFPEGSIPNRDPWSLAPAPMDIPHRANACVWNTREQVDALVDAMERLVRAMQA